MQAAEVRRLIEDERWYCVYDTFDGEKLHHADITSTTPTAVNASQLDKKKSKRRKELQRLLEENLQAASSPENVISIIRSATVAV